MINPFLKVTNQKLKVTGDVLEFVNNFHKDISGDDVVLHGEFTLHRNGTFGENEYETVLPSLHEKQIEREGWIPAIRTMSWNSIGSKVFGFSKGNFMLVFNKEEMYIDILAKDVTLLSFITKMPEQFHVVLPCPNIAAFRYICNLLNI